MTSRERVGKTVAFRTPDRVPIDLGGMKASGISVFAYSRLKKRLGLAGRSKIQDPRFMIALVEEDIRKRFHIDTAPVDMENALWWTAGRDAGWTPRELSDGNVALMPPGVRIGEEANGDWRLLNPDGSPTSFRMPRNGFYFDDMSFDRGTFNPADFKPASTIPQEQLEALARYSSHMYENTEYALLGWGGGVCFLGLSLITTRSDNVTLGKPTEWMTMLLTEKETCHEMMDRSVTASIACLKLMREAVGDRCFAWGIAADDAGTQKGEFINPDLWAEMIKPHYRRLCEWIHANTNWRTFLHCCGSVHRLIPHFVEAGVDILNPVQTSAANMEPERLKREFGGKIVFWGGGCDTQRVLGAATPDEIRAHVRERLKIFAPGGGYVFNQIHDVQANVPPENVEAMLESAYECGLY